MMTDKAVLEIRELTDRASALARGNSNDRQQSSVLLSRIKTIRDQECSSDEMREKYSHALVEQTTALASDKISEARYKQAFHRYLFRGEKALDAETRSDLLAGQQTITYTPGGAAGGFLVPIDYEKIVFAALAQTDPLLSADVCRFTIADTPTLQPQTISGWDLSTITATQVNETVQQSAGNIPSVNGRVLRGNLIYKVSLAASFEAEEDVPGTMSKMAMAMGIGFARKLGQDAVNGNGTTQPQGILTALPLPIYVSLYQDILVHQDLNAIFFSLDRIYRSSALCAWLVSDSVYKRIREAADPVGRPLINMENDREMLLGKPIYICPSLPLVGGSPARNSTLIFGDLSHFFVRCSKATLQRATNVPGYIEYGKALYIARIRMDSALFDPSNGAAPPIVTATVQG